MIHEIKNVQRYGTADATKYSNRSATDKTAGGTQTAQDSKADSIQLGSSQEAPVTYSKVAKKKLDATDIAALKAQADTATENLRKLVEQLILKQNKNYKTSAENASEEQTDLLKITAADIEAAKQAISEDGEFGVKAVSDRLVDFAISISGDDKSKLSTLIGAIDEGFAAAKKALGGSLPDICQKTYDETIRKLNEWAKDTNE